MKKIISLLLTIFAVSAFMGCADDNKSDATQGGQSLDGLIIDPAPKDNVITLKPTSDGKYVLTFTNGTLVNGKVTLESSDVLFQFDMDFNGNDMNGLELIQGESTCHVKQTHVYYRLTKSDDDLSCKITYKLNNNNKKDMFMKKFIVIKNPDTDTYDPNNTQGETITIKHQ